jgi:hypothetical protein
VVYQIFDTQEWETSCGDFSAGASASIPVGDISHFTWKSTPEMVANVQAWLDDPSSIFGWLFMDDESFFQMTKRFDHKDRRSEATRPALMIAWNSQGKTDLGNSMGTTPSPTTTLKPTATATASASLTLEATIASSVLPDLTVSTGITVIWTNKDGAPHTTTSRTNEVVMVRDGIARP